MSNAVGAPSETLPFSEKKQDACLGHLLTNSKFYLAAKDKIQPGWFVNPFCQKVWTAAQAFARAYGRPPTLEEMLEAPSVRSEDQEMKNKLVRKIREAQGAMPFFGLDVIRGELTEWMHARMYYGAMQRSAQLYNDRKFQQAIDEIKGIGKEIDLAKFEQDMEFDPEGYVARFEAKERELEGAISFGLPVLDQLLLPIATSGSMLVGDTTVVLAPVNVGKTTTMLTVGCHNIAVGKRVLLLTHEGRPEDIEEKIWCNLLSVPEAGRFIDKKGLYEMYRTPQGRKHMDLVLQIWKDRLMYVPVNRPGMCVEDIETVIRRKNDEMIARTGKGFDLVIDDYPSKLTSVRAKHGNLQKRHVDEIVYDFFVQLALELKFHALVAVQTNREGSKTMHGRSQKSERRLLVMEDIEESWGPMKIATNVISINRDAEAARGNRVTYLICKSRSSETGYAVVCGSRYGSAISHHEALGATYYRSNLALSERADDLLKQFRGQRIPDEFIRDA